MRNCPAEATATRKELLVATRHILLANEFRTAFMPHIDELLQTEYILGTGLTSQQTLKYVFIFG